MHSMDCNTSVAVASLGGTIAMTPTGQGVVPTKSAADLVEGLAVGEVVTLATTPSASLTFDTLLTTFDWARTQVEQGASGVVIVQGTDTLEETAYFFDCLWPYDVPVVVTGAMRHPALPGADGPANLAAAVTVAGSPNSGGRGSLLVLNDSVHAARWVRKAHSSGPDAFQSAPAGPLGLVAEDVVHYFHSAAKRAEALPRPSAVPRVALLEATLGDDASLLGSLQVDGAVVAAMGVGHVSEIMADAIATASFPVVVATRTGAGTTFRHTYGFQGSESDLIARGALMAGWLCPRKARILLTLLLGANASREQLVREFDRRGSAW